MEDVVEDLAKSMMKVLDVDELSLLCDMFDGDRLDELFYQHLIPQDRVNHPRKYN